MVDNMEWFNVFGLIFIAVIMIPNVVFAIKCKDGFDNKWNNKYIEVTEQVGRLGCFGFMIINIPGTWFGWWSDEAFALYLIVDTILVMLYCAIWIICFKKNSVFRALALSIIPSMLFLFSGIMSRSVLLIIASVLFAPSHIMISYKNVKWYLQIQVCRTDKIPLGTKGRTSILSYREYVRPGSLHSRSAEKNCLTENVASRPSVKVATPPCAAYAAIPCGLAVRKRFWQTVCRQQVWRSDINKSSAWSKPYGGSTVLRTPVYPGRLPVFSVQNTIDGRGQAWLCRAEICPSCVKSLDHLPCRAKHCPAQPFLRLSLSRSAK